MPAYFVSDVHLRLDRPDRARRFADWVDGLASSDPLIVAGDLCDFWFASRQCDADPMACPGLRALAAFGERGGRITILPGNHDLWLGPFYERALGARFVLEPLEVEAYGLRVHLVHGHLLGGRKPWKAGMESRAFLQGFGLLPRPIARGLEALLDRANEQTRTANDLRHMTLYRRYADRLVDRADLVIFGHIHGASDDPTGRPRLIVLGGWHRRSSYLRIDDAGATLVIEDAPARVAP